MDMDWSWADDLPDIGSGYNDSAAHNMADVDDLLSGYLQPEAALPILVDAGKERAEAASSVPIPVEVGNGMVEAASYESVHVPVEAGNEMVEASEEGLVNLQGNRKRRAEWMEEGSERQRWPWGWIETVSAGSNEDGGGEAVYNNHQLVALAMGTEADGGGRRPGEGWWDTVYSSEEDFRLHFRMFRSTFDFVCNEVADLIRKNGEACPVTVIPVPERVAICLWRLANGESLTSVAKRFGHGRTTCHRIFHDVCAAIMAKFVDKEVQWPDGAAMAANAAKFQALSGIQGITGAIYTTRFAITAPKKNITDYYSHRATPSNSSRTSCCIILQASVNADGTFSDVFAGQPGGKSDEETLLASTLSAPESTGKILGQGMRLVGGAGYPLMDWMLVPYSGQNLTPAQQSFNEAVEKVLAVGRDAFRRLKARCSLLQKRIEIKLKGEKKNGEADDVDLALVLQVCCALHNFCERLGDPLDPGLLQGVNLNDDGGKLANDDPSPSASDLRDNIADDLVRMGAA